MQPESRSLGLTRKAVSFLGHGNMAYTLVVWIGSEICSVRDVVKVLDAILCNHVPVAQASIGIRGVENTFCFLGDTGFRTGTECHTLKHSHSQLYSGRQLMLSSTTAAQ